MSKKVNPAAVGIFVAGAVLILLTALVVLGSGELFEKRARFVVYFESSANGLQEGADVLLGGVKVGSVERMRVQIDSETGRKVIPVVIELSADRLADLSADRDYTRDDILSQVAIDGYVSRGLRARLMTKSALTGQLYVDLEIFPDEVESYTFPGDTIEGLPQIPTTKNEIERVLESIAEGVDKLSQIEIGAVVANFDKLITDLDAKVAELDLAGISDGAKQVLNRADGTMADIDTLVKDENLKEMLANLNATSADLKELVAALDAENVNVAVVEATDAIGKVKQAADNIARLTTPDSTTAVRLNRTLASIEEAAKSIEQLADYLKRNPNALISGKRSR